MKVSYYKSVTRSVTDKRPTRVEAMNPKTDQISEPFKVRKDFFFHYIGTNIMAPWGERQGQLAHPLLKVFSYFFTNSSQIHLKCALTMHFEHLKIH